MPTKQPQIKILSQPHDCSPLNCGAGYQNRTGDWTLATCRFTPKLILLDLVVGQGFEPCRSSPSGQSPRFISPRRIPMLPTIHTLWLLESKWPSSSQDKNAIHPKCMIKHIPGPP
jgi:hypothetical protein